MHLLRRRGMAAALLLGAAGVLSAGCGSTSSRSTAHIHGTDLSVNGGTTGVLVNLTAVGGDLSFGQTSAYNYVGQGLSTFSFTTSASIPTTTVAGIAATGDVIPPNSQLQLNNDSYYSAYLIGRADVMPLTITRPDPRFLQTVVAGNKGAAANYQTGAPSTTVTLYSDPPSGEANIRILNAAPDAGPVDVLIGGKPAFTSVAYPLLPVVPAGNTANNAPAVTPVTPYQALPSGTLSVQVNAAGTSTVLVPPTNVSVSSGQSYTVAVTETSITPVYGLHTAND